MCRIPAQFLTLLLVLVLGIPAVAQGTYTVIDLGTLGGEKSLAHDVNNLGQVVGWSMTESGEQHAFLYSGGIMQDLGVLPGGDWSTAQAINDAGVTVGYSTTSTGIYRAYRYSGGPLEPLGTLGDSDSYSYAFDINASGQIVGYSDTSGGGTPHAYLYSAGTMQDLGTLGGTESIAYGLNDSAVVVGVSYTAEGEWRCYVYEDGDMTDLHPWADGYSMLYAVNSSGQCVGQGRPYTGPGGGALLYSDGVMNHLGTLGGHSEAFDINDDGLVVGSYVSGSVRRAIIWADGTMEDLNTLIDPASGWELREAYAVNDLGWIAGWGVNESGKEHAFLLVPEPATLALLAVGGLGIFLKRKRQLVAALGGFVLAIVLLSQPALAGPYPQIREYLLGDIDGIHYDGAGSVDDVYVDPNLWAYADLGSPATPFDLVGADQDIPFTFVFPLAPGEQVTGATLEIGIRAVSSSQNEWLCIHPDDGTIHWTYGATHWAGDHYTVYRFADELGWSAPTTGVGVFVADLANIDGDNRLPWLQDGELNIHITDDFGVDYAKLTIEVAPEPATLALLAAGALGLVAARRRK